ncbi:MAG: 2Fe-2S iron-sulfur cluster-binding protein [Candidatus Omnitrophota bacterium]
MPKITFLPSGKAFKVKQGKTVLDSALENGIPLEHVCGGSGVCTTCHVIIREGMDHLSKMQDDEADRVEPAVGMTLASRLGCQAKIYGDVTVEIPKHTVHIVSESSPFPRKKND